VQRLGIVVEWLANGSLVVRAQDRETGAPVRCTGCTDLLGGVEVVSARALHGA